MSKSKKEQLAETSESPEETVEVSEQDLAIRAAFDANVDSGDEESIKMAMLSAGCKIKAVGRIYNTYMIDSGHMATADEKKDALEAHLNGIDLSDEDIFNAAVVSIEDAVTGASTKSASSMIRSWAKKNEVECWKKPAGTGVRADSFIQKFYGQLRTNPFMTQEELTQFIDENGTKGTKGSEGFFQGVRSAVNGIAEDIKAQQAA